MGSRKFEELQIDFPWLVCQFDPDLRIGCKLCHELKSRGRTDGVWEPRRQDFVLSSSTNLKALRASTLKRHEQSGYHQQALQLHGTGVVEAKSHPPAAEFTELVRVIKVEKKLCFGRSGVSGIGWQKKCRQMAWCLGEASREEKRAMWSRGKDEKFLVSTTVMQDCRSGKLRVRYRAANSRLEIRSGYLGTVNVAHDFSLDSAGLQAATMKVLENFATSRLQVAYPTREVGQASPDQELLSCLVNSVEAFVADAASDEIKCGRLLAGHGGLRPGLNMPNIHLVIRDKAHASRRNLSRGWTADPHLAKIADAFVMGHQSPAKLIEYSKSFSGIFQQRIQQLEQSLQACKAHPRMQDLSYAPHRFDSCTRPFGRAVLFLHPLLLTMVQITEDRKGNEEASAAARFLDWVTPELCLQMAMMADAAEENLQMTRFFDVENFALEDLSFVISSFQDRLDALFTGDVPGTPNAKIAGCLTVPTGYTSHMLKLLSHPFMLRGRSFGKEAGVPAAAVRRCLGRMCNWFLVVKETLAAEFPNFETIQCFGVFRCVPSGTLRKSAPDSLEAAGLLAKLHAVYKMQVPLQSLQDEYYKSRHVAERLATHESLDSGQGVLKKLHHDQSN